MVVWPIYPWYSDPSIHGILTSLSIVFWPPYSWCIVPVRRLFWPIYPWYFDPFTNGILTPLSMVFLAPYPLYFDPLPISWLYIQGIKIPWWFNLPYMGEGQFSERGSIYHGWKLSPGSKYDGSKITICHRQRWQGVNWALMKEHSIAQCSDNLTFWNTSYDKGDHLTVHKSFISSLNILFSKEHDDLYCVYWITKLHTNPYRENNTIGASTFST